MLNDEYKVELLKKLPRYHRNIYEFQQIAAAQTPELELLFRAVDFVLDSWFIETATEYGLSRMEKIAGLSADPADSLDTRRFKLFIKMTENVPFTDITLEERLKILCGEGNYQIIKDYLNYRLQIITNVGVDGSFDEVCNSLLKMLPCNLVLDVANALKEEPVILNCVGTAVNTAFHYMITGDSDYVSVLPADLYKAIGIGGGYTHTITHDGAYEESIAGFYSKAIGVGVACTTCITHDLNSVAEIKGNSIAANPVSMAAIITINQ